MRSQLLLKKYSRNTHEHEDLQMRHTVIIHHPQFVSGENATDIVLIEFAWRFLDSFPFRARAKCYSIG